MQKNSYRTFSFVKSIVTKHRCKEEEMETSSPPPSPQFVRLPQFSHGWKLKTTVSTGNACYRLDLRGNQFWVGLARVQVIGSGLHFIYRHTAVGSVQISLTGHIKELLSKNWYSESEVPLDKLEQSLKEHLWVFVMLPMTKGKLKISINPFTPKLKKYILPTFLRDDV